MNRLINISFILTLLPFYAIAKAPSTPTISAQLQALAQKNQQLIQHSQQSQIHFEQQFADYQKRYDQQLLPTDDMQPIVSSAPNTQQTLPMQSVDVNSSPPESSTNEPGYNEDVSALNATEQTASSTDKRGWQYGF